MVQQVADLFHRDAGLFGKFLVAGLAAEPLVQLALDACQLVHLLHQVHGEADGAALVGHAAGDGLADPPRGVRRELEALGVVELLHGADQAQVAFLDEIQQGHTAAGVALGERDHQTQVRLQQMAACCVAFPHDHGQVLLAGLAKTLLGVEKVLGVEPRLNPFGQLDFVLRCEQGGLANAVQIHPNEIGGWTLGVQILGLGGAGRTGGGVCHRCLLVDP
ncbi:Uncharacterised protein [Mycobacteroides abscessus subsp. massiliense]|nr:Uncharacterised protein [Mycobacteroides abscessus subsp. massiliense]SLA46141.1 Uncharacterised protein [Mycobacteroides abscessus subsp. massiliense]